jgi:putative membrane protein
VRFLIRMLISAGVIFGVAYLSTGNLIAVRDFWPSAVLAALVLALVNAFIRPVIQLVALPVTILTLGVFALVINAGMLYIVGWLVPGFQVAGFWQALVAAFVISLATSLLVRLVEPEEG